MRKQDFINRVVALLQVNETGDIEADQLAALLIDNFDDHVYDAVELSDQASYIKKPVIAVVDALPDPEVLQNGNRYFIARDENALSIAEWKGGSWEYQTTKEGDCIFCFQEQKLIVRTKESFELPANRDSFEMNFNVCEMVRVVHNLNRYPSVVVMDSSNRQIITQVTYTDRNSCEVSWTGETSGKIVCN